MLPLTEKVVLLDQIFKRGIEKFLIRLVRTGHLPSPLRQKDPKYLENNLTNAERAERDCG